MVLNPRHVLPCRRNWPPPSFCIILSAQRVVDNYGDSVVFDVEILNDDFTRPKNSKRFSMINDATVIRKT